MPDFHICFECLEDINGPADEILKCTGPCSREVHDTCASLPRGWRSSTLAKHVLSTFVCSKCRHSLVFLRDFASKFKSLEEKLTGKIEVLENNVGKVSKQMTVNHAHVSEWMDNFATQYNNDEITLHIANLQKNMDDVCHVLDSDANKLHVLETGIRETHRILQGQNEKSIGDEIEDSENNDPSGDLTPPSVSEHATNIDNNSPKNLPKKPKKTPKIVVNSGIEKRKKKRSKNKKKVSSNSPSTADSTSSFSMPELLNGIASLITSIREPSAVPPSAVLPPPKKKKMLFISNVNTETNEADIVTHIKEKFNVHDVTCNVVIPWNKRRCDLRYLNFKLVVPDEHYKKLLNQSKWPNKVIVREWSTNSSNDDLSAGFHTQRRRLH